ncbi:MAG: M28 family peptidase [Coriobacteriia bacterium]
MRVRVFAAVGVVAVAALTVLVKLSVLGGSVADAPAGPAGSLSSSETTSLPVLSTAGAPTGLAVQARPRQPTVPREFDATSALTHVRALEAFGVRAGGSEAERQTATYIRDRLVELGLDVRVEEFPLPNGGASRNVIARVAGSSDTVLVLGAHMDSKPPSPGANDNGSGCGALLEIAAILAADPVVPTVEFVFFGSEEIIGGDPNAHHFGSRHRVSQMSATERARTAGMLSVDMIGYGSAFHSRMMQKGPQALSDMVLAYAAREGVPMTFKQDTSATGLSDHEAYEFAGIPATCVCWRTDPAYHTAEDVSGHLSAARIATTGTLVLGFLRSLDASELVALTAL